MRHVANPQRHLLEAADIGLLEIVLDVDALDTKIGGQPVPRPEQAPHHGVGGQAMIAPPAHLRIGILPPLGTGIIILCLHDMRDIGAMKLPEVEPDGLERPTGSAVAARHAAPELLMEIDEDMQAKAPRARAYLETGRANV